ncbi:peptide ABC transporter substrate-binding protein [Caldalkalibacillus mannanilyticus]|uniref:peptide ABC transporter substrate-binding protein n=1 Tax=Caldalkalibacillus mannanilyticus TaxID=1418 RepID=UPI000469DB17|nr:peptide ABC transporter substrate-binding protein [Caldalkalibacillus mannanilyticus]
MNKKFYKVLCLVLVFVLALTGCFAGQETSTPSTSGEQTGESGNTNTDAKILRLNNSSEPGSLHPAKALGTHDSWVIEHVLEGLTRISADGKAEPAIATKWDVSEDGLSYTFYLRDDAKWSNGDTVTAGDFEVAWKHLLAPSTASQYSYQLYYLVGGEEYNSSEAKDAETLKALEDAVGVKAVDDTTLEVKLKAPTPYFIELLAFYTYLPVNKNVQASNPDWANDASTYVSNGPFKLVEWKNKESIKIAKNDSYYEKDRVKLDEIHFAMIEDENTAWQMYRNGELDVAYPIPGDVLGQLVNSDDKEFIIGSDLATYFYNFNTNRKPLNNVKVRKALAMAIDRQTIVEHVAQGGQQPAYSYTPFGIPDIQGDFQQNNGPLFSEDIELAKKLLAEGLAEEGMDQFPKMVLLYNTSDGHKRIAEAVQEMWRKELGVDITLENVEFQVKIDREKAKDYDISRAGWIGDYVDPMSFLDMFITNGGNNDTGWSNAEYDALIANAKASNDQVQRMADLHAAEKILMEHMPISPIYYYTFPYSQKEHVVGAFKPAGRYPQYQFADIVK